jgi:hypothetical protein
VVSLTTSTLQTGLQNTVAVRESQVMLSYCRCTTTDYGIQVDQRELPAAVEEGVVAAVDPRNTHTWVDKGQEVYGEGKGETLVGQR